MNTFSNKTYILAGLLVAVAGLSGCSQVPDSLPRVSGPLGWAGTGGVMQAGALYFSGQPDAAGFEAAREAGVDLVIDLRMPGEREWNEADTVSGLGMQYLNVPVCREGPGFDRDAMERLHALVAEEPDRKILLHCSSGNRASAWYAVHLVEHYDLPVDQALEVAGRTGLDRPALMGRVREYVAR